MQLVLDALLRHGNEGDPGRFYAFKRGEEVSADHEAVVDAPGAFEPVED